MNFVPAEKAQVIRQPSTANLMLDSADRASPATTSPWDFQITRTNSILNGFFTRIGTTEVVLEWFYANNFSIGDIVVDEDGGATHTVSLSAIGGNDGVFLTYEQALNAFVNAANTAFGYPQWVPGSAAPATGLYVETNVPAASSPSGVGVALNVASVLTDTTFSGPGCAQMGFLPTPGIQLPLQPIYIPDLRPVRYLDFVSAQLTYNQELKDSSTSILARDTLCRVYLTPETGIMPYSWNNPSYDLSGTEAYNFGARPFIIHRQFAMPKQIRWSAQQPIGQIHFTVYLDNGQVCPNPYGPSAFSQEEDWSMTLQVSEV